MNEPSLPTVKRLFALSGNRCAHPNCSLPIVEGSGTVTGIICHIKARSRGGPRYDAKQSPEERHGFENLLLMCARHSKVIDADPKTYTADLLHDFKAMQEREGSIELSKSQASQAEALWRDYRNLYISAGGHVMVGSPGAIQGTHVTIKAVKEKIKTLPAPGTLGSDALRRNYAKHLIDRYNEFASKQPGRTGFKFMAIYAYIKKHLGADWDRTLLSQFGHLVSLLQARIDKTRLGQINCGKGIKNYSGFEDYQRQCMGESDEN